MTTFINTFGGNIVQTTNSGYSSIPLAANTTLSWPTEFQDVNGVVNNIMDVVPTNNGFSLTLPNATLTSVGQSFFINNPSAFSFSLLKNDGTTLLSPINAGTMYYFWLIDNTTQAGTWRNTPAFSGGTFVSSITATSATTGSLTITGSPITSAGTLTFTIVNDLAALSGFGAGTGISARTATNTWALRTIIGDANITINNGNGVAGNPQITLNPNLISLASITVGNIQINTTANLITTTAGNLTLSALQSVVLTSASSQDVIALQNFTINGTGASPQLIKLNNATNSFFTALKNGGSTANVTFLLPIADGTENTLMQTNGASVLSLTSSRITSSGIFQAYIAFTGIGAATSLVAYNATVARNSAGNYTITFPGGLFTNGSSYASTVTAGQGVAGTGGFVVNAPATANPTATTFTFTVNNISGTPTDAGFISAMFIGT